MDAEGQQRLEEHFRNVPDAELRRITTIERHQYREEAFQLALDELARRGLPLLQPDEYWSAYRDEWLAQVGFCHQCWAMTTDDSVGAILPRRLVGMRLLEEGTPCLICQSVVATKWFCVVVPVVRQAKYRVLFDRSVFPDPPKGRRLREGADSAEHVPGGPTRS